MLFPQNVRISKALEQMYELVPTLLPLSWYGKLGKLFSLSGPPILGLDTDEGLGVLLPSVTRGVEPEGI